MPNTSWQQQAPGPQGDEPAGRRSPQEEMHRQARDQEDQVHAPTVHREHGQLQPFEKVGRLQVPVPVVAAHVEHAPVVEDEGGEGDGTQGVDVVASGGHGAGPLGVAATLRADLRLRHDEGTESRSTGTNRGVE
jgi:hypothetical protein